MTVHLDTHDPILGDEWSKGCEVCRLAREATFYEFRKVMPGLGPYETDEFIRRMREVARSHLKLVTP